MLRNLSIAVLLGIFSSSAVQGNDVEVVYSNGDVSVTGDSAANQLKITRLTGNIHQFRGLGGTTVNGSTQPVVLPIQDDLRIWMLGGEDFVHLQRRPGPAPGMSVCLGV